MTRDFGPLAILVALALVVAACVDGSDGESSERSGSTDSEASSDNGAESGQSDTGSDEDPEVVAGIDIEPTIESVDCPFVEPDSVTAECHQVTVPEDWDSGEGK